MAKRQEHVPTCPRHTCIWCLARPGTRPIDGDTQHRGDGEDGKSRMCPECVYYVQAALHLQHIAGNTYDMLQVMQRTETGK